MRGIIFIILFLVLGSPCTIYALSDSEYEILKENSQEFADADKQLGETWKAVKSRLNETEAKKLLNNQRNWIKNGWDEEAGKFIKEQNLSRTKAYTQAIKDRIKFLNEYSPAATPTQTTTNKMSGEDANTVTVEAEGTGSSKKEALQAAWMEAVRQGVGMFMVGKTDSINDELTEKIVTHSRGQVNAYKIIDESNDGGIWRITIIANINKDLIKETVASSQSKKLEFDGKDLAAQNTTSTDKIKSEEELLDQILDEIPKFLDLSPLLIYNAKIGKISRGNINIIYLENILKIDLKKYILQTRELEKLISQISIEKFEIPLALNSSRAIISELKKDNYPKFSEDRLFGFLNSSGSISQSNLQKGIGFYIKGRAWVYNPNSICFYNSPSKSICYRINPGYFRKLSERLKQRYTIKFIAETNDDLDPVISEEQDRISFPFITDIENGIYITPQFEIDNSVGSIVQFYQKLPLTNEQLLNIKNITGKYELLSQ